MTNSRIYALFVACCTGASARAQPVCDGLFHWIDVTGTRCLDGSSTGFEYLCRTGSAESPLLVYIDGGGACWNAGTCDCQPDATGSCTGASSAITNNRFDRSNSHDGRTWLESAIGPREAFTGATSPFGPGWNVAYFPYCTGDAHAGDAARTYTTADGRRYRAYHRGYQNFTRELARLKGLFPAPQRVAAWGNSAGGLGADCNLRQLHAAWPRSAMFEFNNAGAPLNAAYVPDLPEAGRAWGAWHPGEDGEIVDDTCPIETAPDTAGWSPDLVMRYNRMHLADVRKAFSDDYSDATMDGFACLLGATPVGDSCARAVAASLKRALREIGDDDAYRVYFHSGTCHSERENDGNEDPACDYDAMSRHGVRFHDWVNAWMGAPSPIPWTNVR